MQAPVQLGPFMKEAGLRLQTQRTCCAEPTAFSACGPETRPSTPRPGPSLQSSQSTRAGQGLLPILQLCILCFSQPGHSAFHVARTLETSIFGSEAASTPTALRRPCKRPAQQKPSAASGFMRCIQGQMIKQAALMTTTPPQVLKTCFRSSRIAASQAETPLEPQRSRARLRKRTGEETWTKGRGGAASKKGLEFGTTSSCLSVSLQQLLAARSHASNVL